MSIVLVGLNHKTAPVALRERLAFTDEVCTESLRALVDGEIVREGLIVSTCNRVEVLAEMGEARGDAAASHIANFFKRYARHPAQRFHQASLHAY
jgi:Glutamyl-tRNA reductase